MFDSFVLLKTAHILLLATWLGVDIGVLACGWLIGRHQSSVETRAQFARLMVWLGLWPALSLVLTVLVALALVFVGRLGFVGWPADTTAQWMQWLAALTFLWLIATVTAFALNVRDAGVAWLRTCQRGFIWFDTLLRCAVVIGFAWLALRAWQDETLLFLDYLRWKSLIFAGVVACGLWARFALREFLPTLSIIAQQGSTEELEKRLTRQMRAATVPMLISWAGLVANIFIAVIQF
ncbi:MAG: hypothetical protein RMM98_10825 [Acidobacteriota bacterium]|nr:hypothetical protein [Blastocatellia bacterium]MDW8240100.1 hypothetical protein [Acidobacteriota bacterium]